MAKVEYSIQPSWTHQGYEDVIEIDDAELEGLDTAQRIARIEKIVEDQVNNVCSWGWNEVATEGNAGREAGLHTFVTDSDHPYGDYGTCCDMNRYDADAHYQQPVAAE